LLDLLAVPLLLWRRTRLAAFCVTLAFHLINARLFQIGIFPWLAIAATSLFLSPDWPRRVFAFFKTNPMPSDSRIPAADAQNRSLILILFSAYFLIQLLVPLRHWLYPGDVAWTFEGHLFSWRMKLVDRNGEAHFFVTDPNVGVTREVDPANYLSPRQTWKMAAQPDMILQFAHFLARTEPCVGPKPLQVRTKVLLSLNGREPAPLIDPSVDLAAERATLGHARWILPMPQSTPTR
jgi:vitamin K-dependent gamma-carboxylase